MSFIKQAKVIADAHPAQAALVWEMAASDHTEEQILDAVGIKESEAKAAADAAELVDLKARVEAAELKSKESDAAKIQAESKLVEVQAKHDALAAHAKGGAAGAAIKPDAEEAQAKKVTRAEHDKNPSAFASGIRSGTVILVD